MKQPPDSTCARQRLWLCPAVSVRARGAGVVLLAAGLLVANGVFGADEATSRAETQARFDLMMDLVWVAPSALQPEMIETGWRIFSEGLQASPTAMPSNLVAAGAELEARLRQLHPCYPAAWTADSLQWLATPPPLVVTRGLESLVLVELANTSPQPVSSVAVFDGNPRAVQRPVTIPSGGKRTLWATLTVADPQVREVVLRVTGGGGAARILRLPVKVVEPARLRGTLIEGATGKEFPGRVRVLGSDGLLRRDGAHGTNDTLSTKPLLKFVFAGLPKSYTLPFFYSDGRFEIEVPPGETKVTLERGFEHPLVTTNLTLQPGETREVTLVSRRFLDMKQLGWVSGDTHIHWAKNWWSEDEDIRLLAMVQRAEDVRVANNLTLKHHTTNQNFIAPTQYPMGPIPGYCSEDWHIEMAEEYRNEEFYGHLIFLNLKRLVQPISTGFMGGPPFWDYPHNLPAILEAREQGGVVIEAHGLGNDADVPANVAHELADSLDQIEPEDYYRFLECGFQLPLSNGSDHPARLVGSARAYVKTRLPFTYANWLEGLKRNRTFTTSGPLLFLDVNGHDIGDVLDVKPDTVLKVKARAVSRFPLGTVQIVSNNKVIAERTTQEREAELTVELPAGEPRWVVARCAPTARLNAIWEDNVAHTAAIYVLVNGRHRFVAAAAQEWASRLRRHADNIRRTGRFPTEDNRNEAADYVMDAVRIFEAMIEREAGGQASREFSPELRALVANARAVAASLKLNATDRNGLANLERYGDAGAREVIERVMKRHVAVRVNLGTDGRLKMTTVDTPIRLARGEWTPVLIRVANDSGAAGRLQFQFTPLRTPAGNGGTVDIDAAEPASPSVAPLEYRLIKLRSPGAMESGIRVLARLTDSPVAADARAEAVLRLDQSDPGEGQDHPAK